jgi:hypothetical protein
MWYVRLLMGRPDLASDEQAAGHHAEPDVSTEPWVEAAAGVQDHFTRAVIP